MDQVTNNQPETNDKLTPLSSVPTTNFNFTPLFHTGHGGQINEGHALSHPSGRYFAWFRDNVVSPNGQVTVLEYDTVGNLVHIYSGIPSGKMDSVDACWARNKSNPDLADIVFMDTEANGDAGRTDTWLGAAVLAGVAPYVAGLEMQLAGPMAIQGGADTTAPSVADIIAGIVTQLNLHNSPLQLAFSKIVRDSCQAADAALGVLTESNVQGTLNQFIMDRDYEMLVDNMVHKNDGGTLYNAFVQACKDAQPKANV